MLAKLLQEYIKAGGSLRSLSKLSNVPYNTVRSISCGKVNNPRKKTSEALFPFITSKKGCSYSQNFEDNTIFNSDHSPVCETCGIHSMLRSKVDISKVLTIQICSACSSDSELIIKLTTSEIINDLIKSKVSIRNIATATGLKTDSSIHRIIKGEAEQLRISFDSALRFEYFRWIKNPILSHLHTKNNKTHKAQVYDDSVISKYITNILDYINKSWPIKDKNKIKALKISTNVIFSYEPTMFEPIKVDLVLRNKNNKKIIYAINILQRDDSELEKKLITEGFSVSAKISAIWKVNRNVLQAFTSTGHGFQNFPPTDFKNSDINFKNKQEKFKKILFEINGLVELTADSFNSFDKNKWTKEFSEWLKYGYIHPYYFLYTPLQMSKSHTMIDALIKHLEEELQNSFLFFTKDRNLRAPTVQGIRQESLPNS